MTNDYMQWAAGSDIGAHLPYLHQRAAKAKTILELGVRNGCSTAALLAGLDESDGHLTSVDLDTPHAPADEWRWTEPRWTFIQGDDMEDRVRADTPMFLDLLFIDSSHHYQHTMDELDCYGVRVASGGVILLHDTELEIAPGSVSPDDRDFPVRRAIEDWCRRQFLVPEWIPGCYGLGVIEVP